VTGLQRWESGGGYEAYVGRWSRLIAPLFIEWLDPAPDGRWLDIGCGTGALTEAILDSAEPKTVHGIDPSEDFVSSTRSRITDPRAEFSVADAQDLPGDAGAYDYTVSGLVLNFVPDPTVALAEMARVTRSGGCIAAYVWDYLGGMEMMNHFWDAANELDAEVASLDEGLRFPLCKPEPLRSLWEETGLGDVDVAPIEIDTNFRDFDDLWSPFLAGQGAAPTYAMSLDERARDAVRELLRQRLPVEPDGSIHLRARAWGVGGVVVGA
jgi:SAM-dependent methyltransferase